MAVVAGWLAAVSARNAEAETAIVTDGGMAPDDINFREIMKLMTSKHTVELVDRHVSAMRKVCRACKNGFLLKHLESLVALLKLAVARYAAGQEDFGVAICDFTRVASQPFVSCKASDMIKYGSHLPTFIKVLVQVLKHALPPPGEGISDNEDPEVLAAYEQKLATREKIRIEVAHTLACWSRFGLDEDSTVADCGTPNLRILKQSQVMDAVSASFGEEVCTEAILITLGAIRDMSLYRPLARQITNCGLISNLVHHIRINLIQADVLLVAAEILWNVLELDWEGAAEAFGQAEIIECFRDCMDTVMTHGYRFKDRIFRNDVMVLLMYISKREENRPLFATTGLMAVLLTHAITENQRQILQDTGVLHELNRSNISSTGDGGAPQDESTGSVALTNSQEDMEFRMLLWATLARCCTSDLCAQMVSKYGLVQSLLSYLDSQELSTDQRQRSQEQHRKVQLEALSALFLLVQYVPDTFMQSQGNTIVLQLLQTTRSREVQRKCLHLLQVAVRTGAHFADELGHLGAVGMLIELFADKDNPMNSRQVCASLLADLCSNCPGNCREFRKKDGVEAIREEVVYRPDETTNNHLFYTLCVIDCVWCAVVGTRKNEARFIDAGGLFALLDVLEVAPLLLKRQIIGCLADLMQYRKAAKLFVQWNSQVTMKGALKILLELWQTEQDAVRSTGSNGVILDLNRPLNPTAQESPRDSHARVDSRGSDASSLSSSQASGRLRQARSFANTTTKGIGNAPAGIHRILHGTTSDTMQDPKKTAFGSVALDRQDCRAKIYCVLNCIGFECQETLTIAERQQIELVKLYPEAAQLETWIRVHENLNRRGIKPISGDRKWIEDSIGERKSNTTQVQKVQQKLANERENEEQSNLDRFYDDIRSRAQFRKTASFKDGMSRTTTPAMGDELSGDAMLGAMPDLPGDDLL